MHCHHGFRIAVVLLTVFLAMKTATAVQAPSLDRKREATIKRIGDEVKFLASDGLEGRGVSTKGIETSANLIRDEFKKYGLKSGVKDGTYFQPFEITLRDLIGDKNATLTISGVSEKKIELENGKDFQPQNVGGDGDVNAELVFVGYGIDAEDLGYQEYEGLDVKGKVVLILRREPQQNDSKSEFDGTNPSNHALIQTKIKVAKEKGAVGILFCNDSGTSNNGTNDRLAFPHQFRRGANVLPFAFVKRSFVDSILQASPLKSGDKKVASLAEFETLVDKTLEPVSQPLNGIKVAYKAKFEIPTVTTSNVVGVIEGEGPHADETIVIGGHYDHLGYGFYGSLAPANRKGEIHNGADDNATGTIAVVELARRFATAKMKPKRRLVFIAFSGEERGLLGSYYYCRTQPLFPLENTIAMVNYDMIGQMQNNNLTIFGGTSAEGLSDILRKVAEGTDLKLNLVPGGFAGSDHLPFNAKKIPNMFLHTGTGSGLYHTPDDDFETINVEGMADVIDYSEKMIGQLANLENRLPYQSASRSRRRIGYLGVRSDQDSEVKGAFVAEVVADSPAAKAGLKIGDIIRKVDDNEVTSASNLPVALRGTKPGQKVKVVVIRDEKETTIEVELGTPAR